MAWHRSLWTDLRCHTGEAAGRVEPLGLGTRAGSTRGQFAAVWVGWSAVPWTRGRFDSKNLRRFTGSAVSTGFEGFVELRQSSPVCGAQVCARQWLTGRESKHFRDLTYI